MYRMDGARRELRSSFKWIREKAPMVKCLAYGERQLLSSGFKTTFFNQYLVKKLKGLLRCLPFNRSAIPF